MLFLYIKRLFVKNKVMNQILTCNLNKKKLKINGYKGKKNITNKRSGLFFYSTLFTISVMVIITIVLYSIYGYQNRIYQENLSKNLAQGFGISTLYAKNSNYETDISVQKEEKENFSVIGIVKIDSIKISYPILSDINDELLKISPCRFYGPLPNEVGNLCIAAHNYDDNRFFSKIGKLKKGDIISIYDSTGKERLYSVYNVYETKMDDVSCTSQGTEGKREITLVTCNNFNDNRIIVKAKEI